MMKLLKLRFLSKLLIFIICLFFVKNFNSYGLNYKKKETINLEDNNLKLNSKFILVFECQGFLFTYNSIENKIVGYDLINSLVLSDFELGSSTFNGIYVLNNRFFVSVVNESVYELWEIEFEMKRMMIMDLTIEEMECIKVPELGKVSLD